MSNIELINDKQITKETLAAFGDYVATLPNQIDIPVKHYQVKAIEGTPQGGVYAREVIIPAGSLVVGKIHKYQQINIISKGDVSIATEEGVIRVQAPYTVVSPAGVKRAVYAHEDTVWTTIHGTDEDDIEVIESKFIADSYEHYLEFTEQQLLKGE